MRIASDQTIITTTLPSLAALIEKQVEADLASADSVALAIDGWTGDGLLGNVTGVVYHWADKEFKLRSALLDLISVSGNETGLTPLFVLMLCSRAYLCACDSACSAPHNR